MLDSIFFLRIYSGSCFLNYKRNICPALSPSKSITKITYQEMFVHVRYYRVKSINVTFPIIF